METFIEVSFKLGDKEWRPDGLIRVKRGARTWVALVEVKTGKNALRHLSWADLLSAAVLQKEHRGVSDPEQAWILGELIRYLEHPKSGALEFDDMGGDWVGVREAVAAGTLRASDRSVPDVVARFDALLRYVALHLGRRLGTDVTVQLSRKERADPSLRAQALKSLLADTGTLEGLIRIPDTVGDIKVVADLRSGKVTCELTVEAPKAGRPTTRVNWLVRQLREAPGTLRIEASVVNQRGPGMAEPLSVVREDPAALVQDGSRDLKAFAIAQTSPMGTKRGRGRGAFIDSVIVAVDTFYEGVVQNLKAWSAAPPKLREEVDPPGSVRPDLSSTALSSQDGAEPTASAATTVKPVADGGSAGQEQ
ncbi:hypothetical protein JK386_04475 [Nocardioides sp. zg-536]|uniref:Uncharacterized protein n=1 Tax=Nocardioides faecalis TaxID=2803858 RepID=A0A939BUR4_9ACTN|nr:hypothetical protein [Nocardioides faecalis]MBM9459146.1 hypothetical protein [Nocardioides faecalis]QVI59712.1 hypothetical protein KG111_05040 [Nocardioides faecalis]